MCSVLSCSVVSDSATPWTIAHQASLSMGILQARILECVVMPSSRDLPGARTELTLLMRLTLAGGFFNISATWEAHYRWFAVLCLVAQSCPTLCNPIDCSLLDSSIHGDSPGKNTGVDSHFLLQGIFPTQGSTPGLLHCRQILCNLSHQGSP